MCAACPLWPLGHRGPCFIGVGQHRSLQAFTKGSDAGLRDAAGAGDDAKAAVQPLSLGAGAAARESTCEALWLMFAAMTKLISILQDVLSCPRYSFTAIEAGSGIVHLVSEVAEPLHTRMGSMASWQQGSAIPQHPMCWLRLRWIRGGWQLRCVCCRMCLDNMVCFRTGVLPSTCALCVATSLSLYGAAMTQLCDQSFRHCMIGACQEQAQAQGRDALL